MTTTTAPPQQAALTNLYACRSQLLRAEAAALNAADALAGPHQRRAEELSDRLGYVIAFVERLALAVKGDLG